MTPGGAKSSAIVLPWARTLGLFLRYARPSHRWARQDQAVRLDAARSGRDGLKAPSAVGTQLLQAGSLGRHRLSVRPLRLNRWTGAQSRHWSVRAYERRGWS